MASKVLQSCAGVALLAVGVVVGRVSTDNTSSASGGDRSGNGIDYRVLASGGEGGKKSTVDQKAAGPQRLFRVFNAPDGNMATVGLYQQLAGMTGNQISEMLVDVEALPNHARRRELRERLVDYLTMADPLKALEIRDTLAGRKVLEKSFTQLGRNGLASAMQLVEDLEDPAERRKAMVAAFVGASEIDPAGAFASLKTIPGVGTSHYHEVFDNWAETDPLAAAQAALTVGSAAERRAALKIVGQEWAERDPKEALAWLEGAQLSSFERENMRRSALNGIAKRDPVAAMELLSTLDPVVRSRMLPEAVQQLARQEPEAAIEWMRNEPDGYAKSKAVEDSIHYLADRAPEATIDLVREFPELKDNALGNAFRSLARNDLAGALEMMKDWEGDSHYSSILQSVASSYARESPTEALAWAMQLPGDHKPQILSNLIGNMAGDDPMAAAALLDHLATPETQPYHDNAVQNIASTWARRDPVAAAEWLQAFPESDAQTNGMRQIAEQWARADPVSASEWIAEIPSGAARDAAATSLIRRIRKDDPVSAVVWSESLSGESNRHNSLQQVYSEWIQHDRTGALESIADSSLPDEMKRQFVPELQEQYNEPISLGSERRIPGELFDR